PCHPETKTPFFQGFRQWRGPLTTAGWRPAARIRVFSGFSRMGWTPEHPTRRAEMSRPPGGRTVGTRPLRPVAEMLRMAPPVTASVIRAGFPERPSAPPERGLLGQASARAFSERGIRYSIGEPRDDARRVRDLVRQGRDRRTAGCAAHARARRADAHGHGPRARRAAGRDAAELWPADR